MDKKECYEDFIGERISIEINPFQYNSKYEALRNELWKRIKKELNYQNGLLCSFKHIKTVVDKKILVSGIVAQCEVDCG